MVTENSGTDIVDRDTIERGSQFKFDEYLLFRRFQKLVAISIDDFRNLLKTW